MGSRQRPAPRVLENQVHFPSAEFRGYKSDVREGGRRVPLIVRWPGIVAAGAKSTQLVGLIDLFATTADIVGADLARDAREQQNEQATHPEIVEQPMHWVIEAIANGRTTPSRPLQNDATIQIDKQPAN